MTRTVAVGIFCLASRFKAFQRDLLVLWVERVTVHDSLLEPERGDVQIAIEAEMSTREGEELSRCFVRALWKAWGSTDHLLSLIK
ncbi:hypothetical protein [Acinetobacter sp.]|uniref:hypothetical protein n=1 Tax=Acinetobacter sp. TaxID=472 RepID=UPI00388E772C